MYESISCFSESSALSRPFVVDFDTGLHAAILALIRGWKDGFTDIAHTPHIGYERHGQLGHVAGTLIGIANGILKPIAGTLSSLTWICRGIYANVKNSALVHKGLEASPVNTLGLNPVLLLTIGNRVRNQHANDMKKVASTVSGFSPAVCEQIISEFDNIKKQNVDYHSHRHKS